LLGNTEVLYLPEHSGSCCPPSIRWLCSPKKLWYRVQVVLDQTEQLKAAKRVVEIWCAIRGTKQSEYGECMRNIHSTKYMEILEKGLLPIFSDDILTKKNPLCSWWHSVKHCKNDSNLGGTTRQPNASMVQSAVTICEPIEDVRAMLAPALQRSRKPGSCVCVNGLIFYKSRKQKSLILHVGSG